MTEPTDTLAVLSKLIGFDTTSRLPNIQLIEFIEEFLTVHGISSTVIPNEDGSKANLYCTVGPTELPGIMLSGHTDVVPVDGQDWTRPAFSMTQDASRVYGRGTTDMKGFVACALIAAAKASTRELKTPLHLGFSFDEEIGCVGVRSMIDLLDKSPVKPALCIVGEPTELTVATQHKGKLAIEALCRGTECHSAHAPRALNAIHVATDFVNALRKHQEEVKASSKVETNDTTDIAYTTIHVGNIIADNALNIVPNLCTVKFEIRYNSEINPDTLLSSIENSAAQIVQSYQSEFPDAAIEFNVLNAYPGLDTPVNSKVVELVKSLLGANSTTSVAFGTEAGLFSTHLGIPTVVCGPGSMDQGHKPDEYIEIDQLKRCDEMLEKLIMELETESITQK